MRILLIWMETTKAPAYIMPEMQETFWLSKGETMTEQPAQKRTEGIADYIPLIVPTVLAVIAVYVLFPQYNDAGIRNDLAVGK